MNRSNTCPFCNMSVAPYDSERLERKGQAAHGGCVKRKVQPGVYADCVRFLTERGSLFEARALEIKAKAAFTPKELAKVIGTVLRSLIAKTDDARAIAEVTKFAAKIADRLLVEIYVDVSSPSSPRNGAPKSRYA